MSEMFILEKNFVPYFEAFIQESFVQDFKFFDEVRKSGEAARFVYGDSLVSIIDMGPTFRIVSVDTNLLKSVVDMWGAYLYNRVGVEMKDVPSTDENGD